MVRVARSTVAVTQVCFPAAPSNYLQPPVSPVTRDPVPPAALHGAHTHPAQTDKLTDTRANNLINNK